MLYDEILQAVADETVIEQKIFENERHSGINAPKIMFEHVQFMKYQIPDNDFDLFILNYLFH